MVRGYHVYKDIWDAAEGEVLECVREVNNHHDPFAVAMVKNRYVVGHVPRNISALCSLFLRHSGVISCRINGSRRYLADLPQGGLEIPCILVLTGELPFINKTKKLIEAVPSLTGDISSNYHDKEKNSQSPKKKIIKLDCSKCDIDDIGACGGTMSTGQWIQVEKVVLTMVEKENILRIDWELNDIIINCAQVILHNQFPLINGFFSTLVLPTMRPLGQWIENFLQICHCRSNHWITLSTKECQVGEIKVYDSLYDEVDMVTTTMIKRLFNLTNLTVTMPLVQRQKGIKDCGLFAIANATTLAFKDFIDSAAHLDQTKLRQHLVLCLEKNSFTEFPLLDSSQTCN